MRTSHVCVRGATVFLAALTGLSATLDLQTSQKAGVAATPSVLLITLDTVRADHIGCYGYSRIETPGIDGLASDGVRFENAYTQVPITLPSHAVILTGTYPTFNGVRDFTSPPLPANIPTLAEMLRRSGYQTAAFVSSFVLNSMWGLNRGFEVYDDDMGIDKNRPRFLFLLARRGDDTTDRFLAWLDRNSNKPFFAWLHLYDAHSPYRSPEPFHGHYAGRPYDGAIAFDDAQVGRVISRLRALNLYTNTLIVLLSDHGESLGEHGESEHGFFLYNATLHVPLVVKPPGEPVRSLAVPQPVSTVDVASTIAQACKIAPALSRSLQGRSLLNPSVLRESDKLRSNSSGVVYAESYYPRHSFGWHQLRALVTPDFKYIDAPRPELYDLHHDPNERSDIVGANSAVASALRQTLIEFERRFTVAETRSAAKVLDPESLERLKSLGYVAYKAGAAQNDDNETGADPKDKIGIFNRILRASDLIGVAKYAEADQVLADVERQEPELYVAPFQRGESFLAWGKPQPAIGEFLKALSRNPTFDQAALGLGRAYFLVGEDERAATAFELALRSNENNFLARLALGKVHWRQNMLEKAESEFRAVVESHPEFGEAHADYGIILAIRRNYSASLPQIQRGIELGFSEAIAYNYLGICQAELGHPWDAIRSYEKAVELDPRYSAAYLNLALQYRNQGDPAKALAYYATVCKLSGELCKQYASQFPSPGS
jgi:arylsulfatase A-like enzyme/tetratricopeptide (TPR) repeat protein